jgi:hypothetical protein
VEGGCFKLRVLGRKPEELANWIEDSNLSQNICTFLEHSSSTNSFHFNFVGVRANYRSF